MPKRKPRHLDKINPSQREFARLIIEENLRPPEAYQAVPAYNPKSLNAAQAGAARLMRNPKVQVELNRLRIKKIGKDSREGEKMSITREIMAAQYQDLIARSQAAKDRTTERQAMDSLAKLYGLQTDVVKTEHTVNIVEMDQRKRAECKRIAELRMLETQALPSVFEQASDAQKKEAAKTTASKVRE